MEIHFRSLTSPLKNGCLEEDPASFWGGPGLFSPPLSGHYPSDSAEDGLGLLGG